MYRANPPAQLIVSDGRDGRHRRPPALCGDYFAPDEMTFEQLLALAGEYARAVKFFKLNLVPEGHWQAFFGADETIFMASVLAVDTDAMLRRFEARLLATPDYAAWFVPDALRGLHGSYRDTIDAPLLVARTLDLWLGTAMTLPGHGGREVRQLLESILDGLAREMRILVDSAPAELAGAGQLFGPRFLALTQLHDWAPAPGQDEPVAQGAIRHNFHTLTQAVRMLQNGIRGLLPPSLTSQAHDPAISLLIGFVQLFRQLQQRLNRFGDARIDFYFQRVLGMRPRAQRPDSAFLVLQPTAGARQIQVAAGTQFIGGVDANDEDILYAADHAATLNDARVVALHTLFFERAAGRTTGCYVGALDLPGVDSDAEVHAVPLLGAPKPGAALPGDAARFGFALASRVLLMGEGERHVRVLLRYRGARFEDALRGVAGHLHQNDGQDEGKRPVRLGDVFVKLFRGMFRLALSTATGWHQVDAYRPEYRGLNASLPDDCLSLQFTLAPGAPPVTGYDPLVHGDGFATALPVLRCEMTQNEYSYPYDLLAQLLLEEIRIEVDVRGVRQLLLYNQIGQLSAAAPFMPFGPLPALGAYLIVGCAEILAKQLRDVSLDIEWSGLPPGGSLAGHDRGDDVPRKADAVRASLAVLADGKWVQAGDAAPLFADAVDSDGKPLGQTGSARRISLRPTVQFYKPTATVATAGMPALRYSSASMNGLFKLTLDSPDGAFGHQAYPALLARVLTHNARIKRPELMDPLPEPPYTPQIGRIAMNYKAVATIDFDPQRDAATPALRDSFIHLHPLGHQAMSLADTRDIAQIPVVDAAGNLFIGIEGTQVRGTLSLYFYLREDSLPQEASGASALAWSWLDGNRWRRFETNQILDDSTRGFMTSGIVLIRLPQTLNTDSTVMPAGRLWLRVSAERHCARFCSLYAVYAQAIKVTWQADHGQKPEAVLPARRIIKSRSPIAGVAAVHQIGHSFDGQAAESALQFRVRASERLRHKQRALTAADYELLILAQFPEVAKVKCFANLVTAADPRQRVRPGHLLIVPVPHLAGDGAVNGHPTLSGHLIAEIAAYVRRYAGSGVVISVENPVYELVQVRCTIKLRSQLGSGFMSERINQLLCDYLSPWNAAGIDRHFGWTLRQHDVVAFLLDQDCIEAVSGVSLLQIAPLGDPAALQYAMRDNARHPGAQSIQPSYPWSIAVPMRQHWIVIDGQARTHPPKVIGIDALRVGSTFIIPPGEPL